MHNCITALGSIKKKVSVTENTANDTTTYADAATLPLTPSHTAPKELLTGRLHR
jgi:hypothetical protein